MHRRHVVAATVAMAAALVATAVAVPPTITGTSRDDTLTGTSGREFLRGLGGDDVLHGGGGADTLLGGPGIDVLRGGGGPDSLFGGPGPDILSGGPGNDLIKDATDGSADAVTCGPGVDVATVDRRDAVGGDCETVRRALPLGSAPTPVTVEFLGWASAATARAPAFPVPVVAPGGTLTACAPGDRRLDAVFRFHGLAQRASVRIQYDFPTGNDPVALDSMRPRDDGQDRWTSFLAAPVEPGLPNGVYTIRFHVEASGVYTPVGEATVTRACP